ncbi:MAG: IMP cyclohydrolase / Phosphoribosylaminoimidazolecarboxamide formyltransferase, partial [uncultured Friedmanniella sp.]
DRAAPRNNRPRPRGPPPAPARAGLGVRQDRAADGGPGPRRRRGRDRLHGLHRPDHRRRRAAGHPRRGRHRLPRVPRRPGQDPAPEGARRAARRPPAAVAPRPAGRAGRRPVRPADQQPLPVHRDRRVRRDARRVRRADRHRRAGDGAQLGQEPRLRGRGHLTGPVRRAARGPRRRRLHPGGSPGPGRRRVRAHRHLRRRRRQLDGQRRDRHLRPFDGLRRTGRLPGLGGGDLGQGGGAPLRGEPAPAGRALPERVRRRRPGRGRAAARQGDVLQQLRRHRRGPPLGPRLRGAGRRDHQAREPVRDRRRRRHRRGAPAGPRLRPRLRLRRRDRHEPAGQRGDGRAGRRGVHRGGRGPGVRGRRRRGAGPEEEHPDPRRRAAHPGRGRDAWDRRRDAPAAPRPDRARARPGGALDAGRRRAGLRRDPGRPRVRLAGRPRRQEQRDPAGRRRCLRRRRDGPGQPGGLLPARGRAGGGPGAGRRRGLRRVLPVRRRAPDPARRRRPGHRPAGRLGPRRGGHRGRPGRRRDALRHWGPALLPL